MKIKSGLLILAHLGWANFLCAQSTPVVKITHQQTITIGLVDTIASEILHEKRVVNIAFPEGYSADSTTQYPVIYLLDGGVEEDFIPIAGLVRYYTSPWINLFPKSILVGIEGINRRKDFTFATPHLSFVTAMGFDTTAFKNAGGSEKFISFIEKELQPFIAARYKTNAHNTIIGESLGGLLATEILLKKPSLFDSYIIVSPGLWWGDKALLKIAATMPGNFNDSKIKIAVVASSKAEDPQMFADARQLLLSLKKRYPKNTSVYFKYMAEETHATVLHPGVYAAFKLLYAAVKSKTL